MLLAGLRVVRLGQGRAAAFCARLLADAGAAVACAAPEERAPLLDWLTHGTEALDDAALAGADVIVAEGRPSELREAGWDAAALKARNPRAVLALISPFGQTGPRAEEAGSDLTLLAASGIMRMLTGQVDDLAEPPVRAVGGQSAVIGGLAAACAAMGAVLHSAPGAVVDVSIQEALATLAMTELARAGQTGRGWSRRRVGDGNGATVCILPARDGYVAISPREERQWAAWLVAMGAPDWGREARFARKADRVANWDALHALMSEWSRKLGKQEIADLAQEAHVPSFPLREPAEQFASPQLAHRGFWREVAGLRAPGAPFGLTLAPAPARRAGKGALPLSGVRVLDFSWVIAGPTTTRYLAALGAEVIKVEAPGAGDPGRGSELHTVLGQGKRGIVLDLKTEAGRGLARDLAARCDVVVENFATGVMERLGLGVDALRAVNPGLVYLSASGLGRTGPEAGAVAYGTLLQCYAGFAGLNRHPDRAPRVGFAWCDPMCGLMLAFAVSAALWRRGRDGQAARIDFSMIEAMLWTMAAPLLDAAVGRPPVPRGNADDGFALHGVYPCAGEDAWAAVAVPPAAWPAVAASVPGLARFAGLDLAGCVESRAAIDAAMAGWSAGREVAEVLALRGQGALAASVAGARALRDDAHLAARGFWEAQGEGVLPGLPWRADFPRAGGRAPGLGEHTEAVLAEVLGLEAGRIAALRAAGAFGPA